MYNQKMSAGRTRGKFRRNKGFGNSKKRSRFGGGASRFSSKNNKFKSPKLDISAFINRTVNSHVEEEVFIPENSFKDFGLNLTLLKSIEQRGYIKLTPIQDKIIPFILQGKDMVGLANTGTGKTAAFLVPLIEKVLKNTNEQVLIVVPTRELAMQITQELQSITRNINMNICSMTCIGGERVKTQIKRLKDRNNFIIGTPGRLMDLVDRGNLKLNNIHTVVLDEVDRMLDMGFINDIKTLMKHIPKERQTLCFSATISQKIDALINNFLRNPKTISVKKSEAPENIEQDIIRVRNLNKVDILHDLLQDEEFKKVLVFGRTKRGVENLSRKLISRGLKVESIHSDRSQTQRKRALLNFKNNRVQTLVATDVAARGLHIDDITHVINYEVPETYDDYIHRIGRTGRGSNKGKALTFVN
ncbi:MAG: DEAD/DEAH box helicase [Candidatus Nealsonbacteria bacterium]